MTLHRLAALLPILLPLMLIPDAGAQTDKGGARAAVGSQEPAPPGDLSKEDEILIIGQRYGDAKVASESEFGEDEIASHGADSIRDLLTRLQPVIGDGEEPVLLINGRPAGFDRSVLAYPTEALDRIAVLKPEAAGQYGHPSGRRVVNLVLKKRFSSLTTDLGADWATGGGQYGGNLAVGRVMIDGPTRWNLQARLGYDSVLHRRSRTVPRRPGAFDTTGYVSGIGGGEIDPALSLAAGKVVTVAGFPPGALSRVPALADFAATAGDTDAADPNDFDDLLPSRRSMSLNLGVTRPVGGALAASLNIAASTSSSRRVRGLPMASVVLPGNSPWSPFAGDVMLTRPLAGGRALRSNNDADMLSLALTLGGVVEGWETNFSAGYSRNWSRSFLENGIDVARVQSLIDAADSGFDPYAPWDDRFLLARHMRSNGENLNARFNVRRNVVTLPGGPLVASFSLNASRSHTENRLNGSPDVPDTTVRTTRDLIDGALVASVPIARRGEGLVAFLGDISVDLTAGGQSVTGSGLRKRFGADLNWSPVPILQLRGSIDHSETAPTPEQLDGPLVTTLTRIFDYARGEIAEPAWIVGGNPALTRGSRDSLALTATVRPLGDQSVSLNIGYRRTDAKGGVSGFPELTPAVEAAFPERVTRDVEGRLITVDARAINIARNTDAELASGIALRFPAKQSAAASNAPQFTFSLRHRWRLQSDLLIRAGLPVIDQLAESGQSRHNLTLQATAGRRGLGATLAGTWNSASSVPTGNQVFNIKPPVTLNLSMFVEPDRLSGTSKKGGLLHDLKISFEVQNLFNGYRRVTLEDGSVPAGYSRDEVDPLGRVVRLSIRKKL
jgi:hypothetical protein